jgi:hypothetical protein
MDTPHTPPQYSLEYSEGIVEKFVENYARATNCFARFCGMTGLELKYNLVKCFMFNNNRWNVLRDLIKWVEKSKHYEKLSKMSVEDGRVYLTAVKYTVQDYRIFENKDYSGVDTDQN